MTNKWSKYFKVFTNKKKNVFFYNHKRRLHGFEYSIYCPHPFTNWSLNPAYIINNIHEHTIEGFRKTEEIDSVCEMSESDTIYCVGGSTTYCTELYPYHKTWPFKLNQLFGDKIKVINGGVGGWNTLQSLIRFMSWGPFLKPKLTIVYQSKNDLSPFYNGRNSEKKIFLQYENIMVQYGSTNPYSLKNILRYGALVPIVYTDKINPSPTGFLRFDEDMIEQVKYRYDMFSKISDIWGGKIIFLTELMDQHSPYYEYMRILHEVMADISDVNNNAYFTNLYDIFPDKREYYLDKMHLSELGCVAFSEILYFLCKKHIN